VPENSSRRKASLIAWISVAAFALAGCAELPNAAPLTPVDYRGCLLTQSDSSDIALDEVAQYSLNQAAVTYGIARTDLQVKSTKLTSGVTKLVKDGCRLVVVSGSGFGSGVATVAAANPSSNFVYLSEKAEPKISAANLENLVVFGVDLYEVGIISGYLAADLSKVHYVGLGCTSAIGETLLSGAKFGATEYDSENGSTTRVVARVGSLGTAETLLPDVQLIAGCANEFADTDTVSAYIGYGRDNFLDSRFETAKNKIATTVIPQLGRKILEVVASDLEGDFMGGNLGSVTATYGNGLLTLSPDRDIAISSQTLAKLQTVVADYEATLK
jgi:basic membrane lipoprotein Med (substrate-binding protein (PBP1-ABC) superfamily)